MSSGLNIKIFFLYFYSEMSINIFVIMPDNFMLKPHFNFAIREIYLNILAPFLNKFGFIIDLKWKREEHKEPKNFSLWLGRKEPKWKAGISKNSPKSSSKPIWQIRMETSPHMKKYPLTKLVPVINAVSSCQISTLEATYICWTGCIN